MEELRVTPPEQWSTRKGEIVELPSGNVARLRTISLSVCLFNGSVPNHLAAIVKDVIEGGQEAVEQASRSDIKATLGMQSWLIEQVMMEPQIHVGEGPPGEGEIEHGDLTDEDRGFITSYAIRGTAILEPFRNKRIGAEPGHPGEEIRAEAEQHHGDP